MHKYFLSIILVLLFISCEKKPVSHEIVFTAELGFETNQVGSNIPILSNYTNREGFSDNFLIDIPKLTVHKNHLYIADSYNKRINIFSLKSSNELILSISNEGKDFKFARPYEVFVGDENDIYVLASIQDLESYEVQNYSNQTAGIKNYDQFQKNLATIPEENFNIYKFSSDGMFVSKLDDKNFPYPSFLDIDNFGNIYIGYDYITNNQKQSIFHRYNTLGEKDLDFDTVNLDIQTNINDIHYVGTIHSLLNFKNKEEFALMIQYQPTTNSDGEMVPALLDNMVASLSSYQIAENTITQEEIYYSNIVESILGIDTNDRIFLQSYDSELNALKIRVQQDKKSSTYHTPVMSSYYTMFEYFIDRKGNLYNYLLDRAEKLIVLQWFIEKDDDDEEEEELEEEVVEEVVEGEENSEGTE